MSKYVVIEENDRGFYKYFILPKEQYEEEYNNGDWHHYTFEHVLEFDSKEEAEAYVEDQEKNTYVLACHRGDYFVEPYWACQNVFTQPSLYDVIYVGDKEKCEALKEQYEAEYCHGED